MGKVLSEEERRHIIEKLNSKMVATRFIALKLINSSIVMDQVDYTKMDIEIPEFTRNLVNTVEIIVQKDSEEMVKREAGICLENLKRKINPVHAQDVPFCSSCGERMMVSYRFCTKCGDNLRNQKWASNNKTCEKCQNLIDPKWNNCSFCGNLLKIKKEAAKTCKFCKKSVDAAWVLCPYCGSKLSLQPVI